MNKFRLVAVMVIFLSGFSATEASVNLIQNGNFTTVTNGSGYFGPSGDAPGSPFPNSTATGWTSLGYNFVLSSATALPPGTGTTGFELWDAANSGANTWNGLAPSGNFVAMDGDYYTGAIYQDVSGLTKGHVYSLTFTYAFAQQQSFTGATTQTLEVKVGTGLTGATATSTKTTWTSPSTSVASQGFSGWTTVTVNFTATAVKEEIAFLANSTPQVPPFALVSSVSLTAPGPTPGENVGGLAFLGAIALRARARLARKS